MRTPSDFKRVSVVANGGMTIVYLVTSVEGPADEEYVMAGFRQLLTTTNKELVRAEAFTVGQKVVALSR